MRFGFLDPGPLVDGQLQLVAPEPRWIDEVLRSCAHPETVREGSVDAQMNRAKLIDFLRAAPLGRQGGEAGIGRVPTYHFWMLIDPPVGDPAIRMAGGLGLRIGTNAEIERYSGNIGYHVYPSARGSRLAERACQLVIPLAKRHGMERIWITCNPDNIASRRTCERLGAKLVDTVIIPKEHPFRMRGESEKCRYVLDLM
jgi:tagatose 1,6-diphosphate aldolase